MENIKTLAVTFASLGGMEANTDAAYAAHEALADAVDAAVDHEQACSIASAIVKGFNY